MRHHIFFSKRTKMELLRFEEHWGGLSAPNRYHEERDTYLCDLGQLHLQPSTDILSETIYPFKDPYLEMRGVGGDGGEGVRRNGLSLRSRLSRGVRRRCLLSDAPEDIFLLGPHGQGKVHVDPMSAVGFGGRFGPPHQHRQVTIWVHGKLVFAWTALCNAEPEPRNRLFTADQGVFEKFAPEVRQGLWW